MMVPMAPNERWSPDFVSDQLIDGRRFRVLTMVDYCTRECLAPVADSSLSGTRVARELDRLALLVSSLPLSLTTSSDCRPIRLRRIALHRAG